MSLPALTGRAAPPPVSMATVEAALDRLKAHNDNPLRPVAGRAWLLAAGAVWTPWMEPERIALEGGVTLASALAQADLRLDMPVFVTVNLIPVRRAEWATTVIRAGDVVLAIALPLGGKKGGSSAFRLLLSIAIMVVAAIVAGPAGLALSEALGISVEVATTIATVAVSFALNTVVNALLPPPSGLSQGEQPSPTYTLHAQGNYTRIGQAIPEQIGRMKHFLDQAADDFTEYVGDDVYLHKTLCLGVGTFDVEEIGFANTWVQRGTDRNPAYSSVQLSLLAPGDPPTLFSNVVRASPEVAGSTLLAPNEANYARLGPYVLNAAGTEAIALGVDVVFPRGLGKAEDSGATSARAVRVTFRARPIDDAGDALAGWTTIIDETVTRKQLNRPVRLTLKAPLTGYPRWEVDGGRETDKPSSDRVIDEVVWGQLKAYFAPSTGWPGVTILQLKVKANEQVQGNVASRVYAIKTRKLPWRAAGDWTGPAATRAIAPAVAYIVRRYWPDARIDIETLETLHDIWEARGDKVDYVFDAKRSAWEQLRLVCMAGRARPIIAGGIFSVIRDQPREAINAAFSERNIIAGSFSMETLIASEGGADHVIAVYTDARTWTPEATVICAAPGSPKAKGKRMPFPQITDRDHAWREGIYADASDRLRRNFISIETELDGRAVFPGDRALFSHDVPEWGAAAELVDMREDDTGYTARASQAFDWRDDDDAHWAGFTRPSGIAIGPLEIFRVPGDPAAGRIAKPLPAGVPDLADPGVLWTRRNRDGGDTPSQFLFGRDAENFALDVSIVEATPRSLDRVSVALVNHDPAIHEADAGAPPAEATPPGAPSAEALTISALGVSPTPSSGWATITVTVTGAADAVAFEVQLDGWPAFMTGPSPFHFNCYAGPGRQLIVIAVGRYARGAAYVWTGDIGTDDGGFTGGDTGGGGGGWGGPDGSLPP